MKKTVIFIVILLIGLSLLIYFMFYGTPWGKVRTIHNVKEYLKNKYTEEMVIEKTIYDFKEGDYLTYVHPRKNNQLEFRVDMNDQTNEYYDYYFITTWESEVTAGLSPIIDEMFF